MSNGLAHQVPPIKTQTMEIKLICSLLLCAIVYSCRTTHSTMTEPQLHNPIEYEINSSDQLIDTTIVDESKQNRYEDVVRIDTIKECYESAYSELEAMLSGRQQLDFKRAVFITENAFFSNRLNYQYYLNTITTYKEICEVLYSTNHLNAYIFQDSLNLKKNHAIYTVLKDTVTVNGKRFIPLQYDFESNDPKNNWSNSFVTHLLAVGKGNCHSLPYLYKILANEIGAEVYLSLAPNHLYLKHRSKRLGWYNTELTSGQFPSDAWVKASGYITLDAIRNGIYMDTLSQSQSIALCAYDLAMGYSKKTGRTLDGFILKCCDLTLKHHPQNINAMILKAETLKKNYEYYVQIKNNTMANDSFAEMKKLYVTGVQLGYREMPKEMYLEWLETSVKEPDKYENKVINETLNQHSK